MEYKKGIPWSLVNLTIPNEKDQNPIKLFRWFISVPDGEVFYVLVVHGNVKGKFLYRYQEKKKEVLQFERHIGEEYYMTSTQIYFPFILSLAHLKSRLIYLYNMQTGLTRTTILPDELQILGIYAYNFAVIVVCVDKIIRYPHLDDLKSGITTIPFEESFSSFVDVFDKSNMLYVESANVANEKEIITRILDLSTGKIQKKSPPWKLSSFSVQKNFTENYYCALQQGTLYSYFKKSDQAYQMTNVTSFLLVTGNLKPKIIVGSPSGSVSVFIVTDTQSDVDFKFMGCCEPQAYIGIMDLKADPNMDWKVLNLFHFKSEYIASVTSHYVFICNISTFTVVSALEIATPERSVLYDRHLYLYFEHPKTQILRIDLEGSLLKLDKTQKDSKKGPNSTLSPRGSPRSSPRRTGEKSAMHIISPYSSLPSHPGSASNSSANLSSRDHTTTSSRDSTPPPNVPINPINIPPTSATTSQPRVRKTSVAIYSSSSPPSSSASQSSSGPPERWKRSQPGNEQPQRTSLNSLNSPRMNLTSNSASSGTNNTNDSATSGASAHAPEQGTRSRSREELATTVACLSSSMGLPALAPLGIPKIDLMNDRVTHRHSEGSTKWKRPSGSRPDSLGSFSPRHSATTTERRSRGARKMSPVPQLLSTLSTTTSSTTTSYSHSTNTEEESELPESAAREDEVRVLQHGAFDRGLPSILIVEAVYEHEHEFSPTDSPFQSRSQHGSNCSTNNNSPVNTNDYHSPARKHELGANYKISTDEANDTNRARELYYERQHSDSALPVYSEEFTPRDREEFNSTNLNDSGNKNFDRSVHDQQQQQRFESAISGGKLLPALPVIANKDPVHGLDGGEKETLENYFKKEDFYQS